MARARDPLAYALYLLGRRGRTTHELRTKLADKNYETAEIAAIVEKLQRIGLLDDALYARHYVRDKTAIYRRGRYRIGLELRQKGVAKDLIDAALLTLEQADELAAAVSLLKGRARAWQNLDERKRFERSVHLLQRRGFNGPVIRAALAQLAAEEKP